MLKIEYDRPLNADQIEPAPLQVSSPGLPKGIIVGHTHWDREWYLPFEGFRARLVAMLDELLEILEAEPEMRSFMLDGQAIMLEDYLEVRPEAEERVRHLVSAGRLKVGPWYTATDTLLPDPEALVRNLQLGRWASHRFGGQPMPVGYMPDLFGFCGQLPQILHNFGIESAQAWRGLHPENAANVCWWDAPDGSRVLVLRPNGGYSEAAVGVVSPERFLAEILPSLIEDQNKGLYRNRLFMMGSDHFRAAGHLPKLAQQIAERVGHPVEVGSLEEMVELVKAETVSMPVIRGEQRDSCLVVCPASVAGTRIPLKQANQKVEAALLGVAEPLQALAELTGAGSDRAHLRWAWRLLVQNHAHDSIPGCGIDEVHREMQTRFARAAMVAKDLIQRGARRLARNLKPEMRGELGAIGVVSLTGGKNRLRVRLHGPETGVPVFRLAEQNGHEVPFAVIGQGQEYVQYHRLQDAFATHDATAYIHIVAPQTWVEEHRTRPSMLLLPWVEIEFEIEAPKAGYRILRLEKAKNLPKARPLTTKHNEISNERLRVCAAEAGLYIEDRKLERTFGPVYFSHTGEAGDEYTACPVEGTTITFTPDTAKAKVVKQGLTEQLVLPIKAQVPAHLRPDRKGRAGWVTLTGKLAVSLQDSRVDLKLDLVNQAHDYDLRLVARVQDGQTASCGAPFAVEQRPFETDHVILEKPAQQALADFPFRGWVALQTGEGTGMAVLARGLYEAAVAKVEDGAEIALTLLRGVATLSRHDLTTRPEHAGPMILTPDAQCLGPQHWELALLPFGSAEAKLLPALTEQFLRPAEAFPVQWSAGTAPAECSLFEGAEELVISTLTPSFSGAGAILHAYNPTGKLLQAQVAGEPVRLDETPTEAVNPAEVKPFAIRAWKIEIKKD
jgi:alpha-mannosidase